MSIKRYFTEQGTDPIVAVEWEPRTAKITNNKGETIFEQNNVMFPKSWSQNATNVVASKYFRGALGTQEREYSVAQVVNRVADTIARWGGQSDIFADELKYILINQMGAFNSPVWFNVGILEDAQCSACFINSVDDTMESILDLAKTEAKLFKGGSGTGTNMSTLRSSKEKLSGGGTASGPVSFMKGFDAFAGIIRSGGKLRRAAKMVLLDVRHPDILDFIQCKVSEERKANVLIDAGYDGSIGGDAYSSIFFQNSNNSVRVSDEFMNDAILKRTWNTHAVTTGEVVDTYNADDLLEEISLATYHCGDPGIQFKDTINDWNTCLGSGFIHASNPCAEFVFLDDSACNLASLNLLKFLNEDGSFNIEAFIHTIDIFIVAQEIICEHSSYPTPKIAENSHKFRPLGLGYANLGALLMTLGIPYDSGKGRTYAKAITALMTGEAYKQSALLAKELGAFDKFEHNRVPMLNVIVAHKENLPLIDRSLVPEIYKAAEKAWDEAYKLGKEYGYRNAQVTLLAPTGTIAFMMDCDTTGVEPEMALVKYKSLVGGGVMKIVNQTVANALARLNYAPHEIDSIIDYIKVHDTIEGSSVISKDLPVFDCALQAPGGTRVISPRGHLKMMAAIQPFLSGAISKTVNVSNSTTVAEIKDIYIEAWQLGLKSISIYREGSKRTQPLNTKKEPCECNEALVEELQSHRKRLPDERQSVTHKFSISGYEGYLTVGMYTDGRLGEVFIRMSKAGSVVNGLADALAIAVSVGLQHGVPLDTLVQKFINSRFEPSGFTTNKEIPIASSITDYVFKWLDLKYGEGKAAQVNNNVVLAPAMNDSLGDAPTCTSCGGLTRRTGKCYTCTTCGETGGCG